MLARWSDPAASVPLRKIGARHYAHSVFRRAHFKLHTGSYVEDVLFAANCLFTESGFGSFMPFSSLIGALTSGCEDRPPCRPLLFLGARREIRKGAIYTAPEQKRKGDNIVRIREVLAFG